MSGGKAWTPAKIYAAAVPLLFAIILILPPTREAFLAATTAHPLIMGFVKFALLATVGEILAGRVLNGAYAFPAGAIWKAVVWGLIGTGMALLLPVYATGITAMPVVGGVEGGWGTFLRAFATSTSLNVTFGPAMMASHRITDTMIEQRVHKEKRSLLETVGVIDWPGFVRVVMFQNIPFFWIPAHTITFLLPPVYRVFVSAALSIVLGLMLAFAKKKSAK